MTGLIYLFDKPKGITTFDVIRKVKPFLAKKKKEKIGHFGTLDPFATGLVLVGHGPTNRLNPFIHEFLPKMYLAKGILGEKRDTGDVTGKCLVRLPKTREAQTSLSEITLEALNQKMQFFVGRPYFQAPPAYSAAKYQGKSLYEYARMGVSIKKKPVCKRIYRLEARHFSFPEMEFLVVVSSGTYIRVLWEDICLHLGTLGYLASLRRLAYGDTSVARISSCFPSPSHVCPSELLKFQKVKVDVPQTRAFLHGQSIVSKKPHIPGEGEMGKSKYCWVFGTSFLLGLGIQGPKGEILPKINFFTGPSPC